MTSYKNNNRVKGRVEPVKIPEKKKFVFQVTVTSLHFTKLDSYRNCHTGKSKNLY